MTLKSGTGQACAACKYQRRRCTPECLLAPFFPADQPKIFQNVHRLFGVKNIQNLLKELSPDQKFMAMKSIKFHATMRDKYPVYGCLVEIQQLSYQIQVAEEELQAVLQQLNYYKQQQQQQQQQQDMSARNDYLSELQLGMAPPGIENPGGPQYSDNADYGITYLDFKDNSNNNNNNVVVNSLCQQQQAYSNSNDHHHNNNNNVNDSNNNNNTMMHSQLIVQQPVTVEQDTTPDYNEIHPFFDQIDDTQSYIGSKEAYESSLESPLKDSRVQLVEQMDENELKSAAACFSLTSVN